MSMSGTLARRAALIALLGLSTLGRAVDAAAGRSVAPAEDVYEKDIAFALHELERRCATLLALKAVDWGDVRREFTKEARSVDSAGAHMALLYRLVARLEDGHAEVRPLTAGESVLLPEDWTLERRGPGLFLCRAGKRLHVKSAWGEARQLGIEPGMELVRVDGQPAAKWLEVRIAELRDRTGFSTDQQAFFFATHWGLAHPAGTRLELELADAKGKKRKRTVTCVEKSSVPDGPAFPVAGLAEAGESIRYVRSAGGYGYVHVRRVREAILEELDRALGELARSPGLILDFRGNSGGGCDHDAFEARFVPLGHEMPRLARPPLAGAGPHPYGGPVVAIVDATVRSAGETLSGMLGEDGRAFLIGESPTAGMSSQKETIELPSGLFALYVSVASNRGSFNGGRGIEGLGVAPAEQLDYVPAELAAGIDTMIRRAEELLADFPQKDVAYDPREYGWER